MPDSPELGPDDQDLDLDLPPDESGEATAEAGLTDEAGQ